MWRRVGFGPARRGREVRARPLVEVPQQGALPLVPDPGPHATVVRVGEQQKHVQPIEGGDPAGERLHQSRLAEVAALGELRHLQVRVDEEHDVRGQARFQAQAGAYALGDACALADVPASTSLADVVHE